MAAAFKAAATSVPEQAPFTCTPPVPWPPSEATLGEELVAGDGAAPLVAGDVDEPVVDADPVAELGEEQAVATRTTIAAASVGVQFERMSWDLGWRLTDRRRRDLDLSAR